MNNILASKLTTVLKNNNVIPKDYLEAARFIALEYLNQKNDTLSSFMLSCRDTNLFKIKIIGREASTHRVNTVMSLVADHAALSIGNSANWRKLLDATISNLTDSKSDMDQWMLPKLLILQSRLTLVQQAAEWMKSFDIPNIVSIAEGYNTFADLKASVNDMFKELINLQSYGIKPCSFEDGIFNAKDNGRFWIYTPSDFLSASAIPFSGQNPIGNKFLTIIGQILKSTNIASINIDKEREVSIKEYSSNSPSLYTGVSITSCLPFDIGYDGSLYVISSPGIISLEKIALRENVAFVYEVLRMNAVIRLYDLIVPLVVVAKEPRLPFSKKILGFTKNIGSLNPNLILQRIKILFEKRKEVVDQLDQEVEIAMKSSDLTKVEHDVIWHIRKLPQGYKASEKAKNMAREYLRRELQPGETFVATHTRNVGGHKQKSIHVAKVVH